MPEKFRVTIDDTGMLNTGEVPELSIIGNDTTTQLSSARDNTNDIFGEHWARAEIIRFLTNCGMTSH